jgi:hypothetical protein
MTAGKEIIRFLKRQIEGKMMQSENLQFFFPKVYLDIVFTPDDVSKAVNELQCSIFEKIDLAHTILEKGVRMFAILIKNGEEDLIAEFRKHELLDAQLPLSETQAKQVAGDFDISFAREYQRQFLPYKFPGDMRNFHRHINDKKRILPFVDEPKAVDSGGFDDIFRVTIFDSQQKLILDKVFSSYPFSF